MSSTMHAVVEDVAARPVGSERLDHGLVGAGVDRVAGGHRGRVGGLGRGVGGVVAPGDGPDHRVAVVQVVAGGRIPGQADGVVSGDGHQAGDGRGHRVVGDDACPRPGPTGCPTGRWPSTQNDRTPSRAGVSTGRGGPGGHGPDVDVGRHVEPGRSSERGAPVPRMSPRPKAGSPSVMPAETASWSPFLAKALVWARVMFSMDRLAITGGCRSTTTAPASATRPVMGWLNWSRAWSSSRATGGATVVGHAHGLEAHGEQRPGGDARLDAAQRGVHLGHAGGRVGEEPVRAGEGAPAGRLDGDAGDQRRVPGEPGRESVQGQVAAAEVFHRDRVLVHHAVEVGQGDLLGDGQRGQVAGQPGIEEHVVADGVAQADRVLGRVEGPVAIAPPGSRGRRGA